MTERRTATREENVIESDSESDDPEDWVDVDERLSEKNEIFCDKREAQAEEEG